MNEYLKDELAANSNDEKHMQKVEFQAGKKLNASAAKIARRWLAFLQKRPGQVPSNMLLLLVAQPLNISLSGAMSVLNPQQLAAASYQLWQMVWSCGCFIYSTVEPSLARPLL